jgi:hypothetical protein
LGASSDPPQTVISPFNFFFHSPFHDSQEKRRRIGLPLLEIDVRDTLIIMENSLKPNFSSFPLGYTKETQFCTRERRVTKLGNSALQYKRDTRVSRQNQATLHISSCLLALSYA